MNVIEVFKIVGDAGVDVGVIMSIRVNGDSVTFVMFSGDKIIVAGAGDKEGDFDIIFFENVKEFGGVGSGAVVKGEVDDFLAGFGEFCGGGELGEGNFFGDSDGFEAAFGGFFSVW